MILNNQDTYSSEMSTTDHKISEVVDTVEALHKMVTKAFAVDKEIEQRFQN